MSTLYTVLGLPESATDEQIKQAYRMLAKKYHPDLHPDDAGVAKKFAEINEAMETLGNPQKRKEYDNKRAAEKKQTEAAAAARAAAARAAAARTASARAGMGGATARPYVGTAQGAAAVVNDAYRKGYNEGFAAANAQRNAAAETWKKSADNWQKEAERCRGEVSVLKAALEKTRQRAADAEASARRMEASLSLQRNATEEARRTTAAEAEAKAELREQYEAKIQAEREARRYSDADKVRLSREVTRLKEENDALRARLGEAGISGIPPVTETVRVTPVIEPTPVTPIAETVRVTPVIE
ncbi:MAG: J domain-containing protein, partial [Clostridiales bacterium]|nr:J domain-containing protein [Clostridiales bacterium]